jgi:hypothetical protein
LRAMIESAICRALTVLADAPTDECTASFLTSHDVKIGDMAAVARAGFANVGPHAREAGT